MQILIFFLHIYRNIYYAKYYGMAAGGKNEDIGKKIKRGKEKLRKITNKTSSRKKISKEGGGGMHNIYPCIFTLILLVSATVRAFREAFFLKFFRVTIFIYLFISMFITLFLCLKNYLNFNFKKKSGFTYYQWSIKKC